MFEPLHITYRWLIAHPKIVSDVVPLVSVSTALVAVFFGPLIQGKIAKRQAANALEIAKNQGENQLQLAEKSADNSFRLARKQIIAPMRQAWINSLRDRVSELLSTLVWFHRSPSSPSPSVYDAFHERPRDEQNEQMLLKIQLLRVQIKLMLNPNEDDHQSFLKHLDETILASYPDNRKSAAFEGFFDEAALRCGAILKREWERVKADDETPAALEGATASIP